MFLRNVGKLPTRLHGIITHKINYHGFANLKSHTRDALSSLFPNFSLESNYSVKFSLEIVWGIYCPKTEE